MPDMCLGRYQGLPGALSWLSGGDIALSTARGTDVLSGWKLGPPEELAAGVIVGFFWKKAVVLCNPCYLRRILKCAVLWHFATITAIPVQSCSHFAQLKLHPLNQLPIPSSRGFSYCHST